MKVRQIKQIFSAKETIEGAGVKLKRVFGYKEAPLFDPFLLLDHFGSENPDDYLAGFPWHPHRGIETVTYMLNGIIEHGDSLGNQGIIKKGDVQWMTAGSGIIHQEMPQKSDTELEGFQLWVNLPAKHKMTAPCYRDITSNMIPDIKSDKNTEIKIIAGEYNNTKGPARNIITEPAYYDIKLKKDSTFEYKTDIQNNIFIYVYRGKLLIDQEKQSVSKQNIILFDNGDLIKVKTLDEPASFLFASGKPLNEPIAWYGPIVMNTHEEVRKAFEEYRTGTFIKE